MTRILLVDDEQYIRELYAEVLGNAGYEVETSSDGQIGYEKILKGGFDLILLDVMLPHLDGIGILRKLKEEKPEVANGKIMLLTNLSCEPVMKEAMEFGAVTCQNKAEMNPDEFLEKVASVLK